MNMNNLTVENNNLNPQHLKPRASIIGKLERSSFQAQRLSDVGVAFSQQITAKVGLKLPASQERIVEQTRWLYLRYVFVKLRQNKLPLRDLNLTKSSRARRAAALGASSEAQIIVSISEPPSADALTQSDQRPLFTPLRSNNRKRSALAAAMDARDLSLFAARVSRKRQALRHQRECLDENQQQQASDEENNAVSSSSAPAHARLTSRLTSAALNFSTTRLGSLSNSSRRVDASQANNATSVVAPPISTSTTATTATVAPSSRKYMMDPTINNQIFTVITNMIRELRESRPEFYGDTVYEMIGLDKFSSLESLLEVQKTLCQEMTRTEISWDRIVALFSLFGAMSLDCVRLGAPEHVGPILDGFIGFVERDLALWISQQGGWESFLYKFRAGYHYSSLCKVTALSVPLLIVWAFLFAYSSNGSDTH